MILGRLWMTYALFSERRPSRAFFRRGRFLVRMGFRERMAPAVFSSL